jgi:CheY-like chemotaxis protein
MTQSPRCAQDGRRLPPCPFAQPPRILIVDDDPAVRDTWCRLVKAWGYACRDATDGAAALGYLQHQRVALVLTDYEMPRVDGLGLLRGLAALADTTGDAAIPAVVVSGNVSNELTAQAIAAGARAIFAKPVPLASLRATIDRLVAERPPNAAWCPQRRRALSWERCVPW